MEQNLSFCLGNISCSPEVREVLREANVPQDELLRYHLFAPSAELQADHQHAITHNEWICSSFELRTSEKTVWIITDPQQKSTNLYLEPYNA